MKEILLIVLIFIVSIVFFHFHEQGQKQEQETVKGLNNQCVEQMNKNAAGTYLQGVDAKEYCGCLQNKGLKLKPQNKKQAVELVSKPCFSEYIRPSVVNFCEKNKRTTHGWSVSCSCIGSEAVNAFVEKEMSLSGNIAKQDQNFIEKAALIKCSTR